MSIKIDKQILAEKINSLEGIDNETKSQLLGLLYEQTRYGLVWEDKPEDVEENLRSELPILKEVKERVIISDEPTAPNHILIEGDNLEALTSLSYTHEEKIDVIYIDPPYNTGNNDFIYNDSFVDSEDDYRHSKWLSFMAKRLKIAKKLLSESGVIFISIDDNEQANLKLLCDNIFGESNFIANLVWQKKFSRSNDALYFSTMHDHILCYVKNNIKNNPNGWKIGLLERIGDVPNGYSNPDNDPRGPWTSTIMSAKSGGASLLYEIETPSGRIVTPPSGRYWSCSKDTFEKWKAENRIWFGKKGDGTPRKKTFLSEVQDGLRPNSLITLEEGGNNQEGKQELKAIFGGEGIFDGPKPTKLLRYLLTVANGKDNIILDFFAGSGTTLHATMQLNAEDGGHRQCIIVTNNENNICEEVTYERNKRVIQGYTNSKGEQIEGLTANNLRYYKTDFVARESSLSAKKELMSASTDMLCIKNDIYHEEDAFGGRKFRKDILRFFTEGEKKMLVIYHPDAIINVVDILREMTIETPVIVYVFSANDYAMDADFEDVADKVSLCALPDAILRAYRRVLPKKKMED